MKLVCGIEHLSYVDVRVMAALPHACCGSQRIVVSFRNATLCSFQRAGDGDKWFANCIY